VEQPLSQPLRLIDRCSPRAERCIRDTWAQNPRITLHFTPTSCSWLNMVEIFFGIITGQAIRRGTFTSVGDLEDAIRDFIEAYNDLHLDQDRRHHPDQSQT
jgi:hypothetical protein